MNEVEKLKEDLRKSIESLERSLKENHKKIDDTFYKIRDNKIENIKYYLINISIVCATFIPFSSLVFQIPQEKLPTNIVLWVFSLFALILSLGLFLYSFLKLMDAERKHYTKVLLQFLNSSSVDFLSLSGKNSDDKLTELSNILISQEKFSREIKNPYEEKDFVNLFKYIKLGSRIFIIGLCLFFLSIVYIKTIKFLYFIYEIVF